MPAARRDRGRDVRLPARFPGAGLRGDYLAIVTLGFGEIIRLLANNLTSLTGGPDGIGIPKPTVFGYEMARSASVEDLP